MRFSSNPNVAFTAAAALAPPEAQVNPQMAAQYEKDLVEAQAAPLPDDAADDF